MLHSEYSKSEPSFSDNTRYDCILSQFKRKKGTHESFSCLSEKILRVCIIVTITIYVTADRSLLSPSSIM